MSLPSIKNRVGNAVTGTPGTGTITLASAETGYQSFSAAYGANANVDILIEEGDAWEIARDCTYTHSGTTVTRGTLEASSTGSALSLTSAAKVYVIHTAARVNPVFDLVQVFGLNEVSVTTTATATVGHMHVCSGTTADYTVTLPAASGNTGKLIGLRMSNALTKIVTIDGNASETIDDATTRKMWAGEVAILMCNGTGWVKVAGKSIAMAAQMSRDAAQAIGNETVVKIAFDAVVFNSAGMADATTNDRFDIKRSGKYLIAGSWYLNAGGAGMLQSRIHVDGSEVKTAVLPQANAGLPIISEVFDLTAGSYVELHAYHNTGSSQNTATSSATKPRMTVTEIPAW